MTLLHIFLEFHWSNLLQPQFYIENGGLWLLMFVIFAETGLFAGFFLPGDSLLFVAGIYATEMEKNGEVLPGLADQFWKVAGITNIQNEWLDLLVLGSLLAICGILGNAVGYWTGRKVGPGMYRWKDNFFFKKKYLEEAHNFLMEHGAIAIVGARFLPFVRTFAPIVAGIVNMDRAKFFALNVIGSITWVFSMLFAGHFLQKWILIQFGFDLKEHLEVIVIGIVAITSLPVFWKVFFAKKKPKLPPTVL